jgi:hypothetical protein
MELSKAMNILIRNANSILQIGHHVPWDRMHTSKRYSIYLTVNFRMKMSSNVGYSHLQLEIEPEFHLILHFDH